MDESNTRLSAKRLVFVFVETKLTFPTWLLLLL